MKDKHHRTGLGVSGSQWNDLSLCMWKWSTKREKQEIKAICQSQHLCILNSLRVSAWHLLEQSLRTAALRNGHWERATETGWPTAYAVCVDVKGWVETYECRPWTPPSTWADIVLFSNFSSPEYIIELRIKQKTCIIDTWFVQTLISGSQKQWFLHFVTVAESHHDQRHGS